jgi:NAD(P)-dependent dehydrogenase (short-subunit alcohol dehydrogenase family)
MRTAIVTGGAGSIGSATVARLVARDMNVLVIDKDPDLLGQIAGRFSKDKVVKFACDATDPEGVERAADLAKSRFGRIDALVNIAGGAGPVKVGEIEKIDLKTWDHVVDLNIKSTFLFCRAVVPTMKAQGYGRIVNFSSIIAKGEKGPPTTVAARLPYATAKAALLGFTAQLAKDLASHGITVNALLPGLILGDKGTRIRDRFEALPTDQKSAMIAAYPIGRAGEADEVAAAVEFLISEAAGYITGSELAIDGAYL